MTDSASAVSLRTATFGDLVERARTALLGEELARSMMEEGLFLKEETRLLFFEPFARMVGDGLTPVRALRAIAEYTAHKQLQRMLRRLDEKITSGMSLEQALASFPRTFDSATVSTIYTAAQAGDLGPALHDIVKGLKRQVAMGRKVTKAVIYPCIALVLTGVSLGINLLVVTPKLTPIYAEIPPDKMPAVTKLLVTMSDVYSAAPVSITAVLLASIAALVMWGKTYQGRQMMLGAMMVVPVARKLLAELTMVRWLRDMARMTRNGKPAPAAAELLLEGIATPSLFPRYRDIHTDLVNGAALSQAMQVSELFPSDLVVYIRAGEEAGQVPDMMLSAAEYAADKAEANLDKLIDLLPSFMMILVGGVVSLLTLGQWMGIFALQRIAQK